MREYRTAKNLPETTRGEGPGPEPEPGHRAVGVGLKGGNPRMGISAGRTDFDAFTLGAVSLRLGEETPFDAADAKVTNVRKRTSIWSVNTGRDGN